MVRWNVKRKVLACFVNELLKDMRDGRNIDRKWWIARFWVLVPNFPTKYYP